jgi:hypothetical protein
VSDDRVTVKLKEPVTFGSEVVAELHLRRPRAKDFRRFPMQPTIGDVLDLVGVLAGQPKPVIDELGVADLSAVMGIVGDFVPGGLPTGTEPSR